MLIIIHTNKILNLAKTEKKRKKRLQIDPSGSNPKFIQTVKRTIASFFLFFFFNLRKMKLNVPEEEAGTKTDETRQILKRRIKISIP